MAKSHRRGYYFERKIAEALQVIWPNCERAHAGRRKGDLVGTGKFNIECKFHKTLQPGTWIAKLEMIHKESDAPWLLIMRSDGRAKQYGTITVFPLGEHPLGVHGYTQFKFTDFLSLTGHGFVPEIVTYKGRRYFVQTLEACILHLKQSKGERCVPSSLDEFRSMSPLS